MSESTTETTDSTTDDTTTSTETTTDTTSTDTGDGKDLAAEVEKWKALSRKHEAQSKSNADKAKRLDEIEEANKTELQKVTDKVTAAEKLAAEKVAESVVLRAAVKHKLDDADIEVLAEAVGSHGTPEEIDARAEKFAARLATAATPTGTADFGGGNRGTDVEGKTQLTREQLKDMTPEAIEQARTEGRLNNVLGIKTNT